MFCTSCGNTVSDLDTFCLHCGARVGSGVGASNLAGGLKPLGVGERIDGAIKSYRANYKTMVTALFAVVIVFALLQGLVKASINPQPFVHTQTDPLTGLPVTHVNYGQFWSFIAGTLLVLMLSLLAAQWASAVCIQVVGGSIVGSPVVARVARRRAIARLGSIAWILILVALIWLAPVAISTLIFLFFYALGVKVLGVVLLIVGLILSYVFFFWFYVVQSLAVPSLMLEDVRGQHAIRRSMALVKNSFWSVTGTLVLSAIIVTVASLVVQLVFGLIQHAAGNGTGALFVVGSAQYFVTLIVFVPFSASVLAILTIDMRVRKEGLDLELLTRQISEMGDGTASPGTSLGSGSAFPSLDPPPEDGDGGSDTTAPPPPA